MHAEPSASRNSAAKFLLSLTDQYPFMELLPAEDFVLISIIVCIRTSILTPPFYFLVIMDPPDEDLFSPPPSYSEQYFDTKISQATDLSLQSSRREAQLVIDEDGWPRYDPAMFEEESTPSMKGKEYSATSFTSAESSGVKKRPLPDISSIKPSNNAGSSNIPQTAPLHIAKKSISKAQEAALETRTTASQFASDPLQPDPGLTLENFQNTTTRSFSDHQTEDVPLYSFEYSGGVPDKTGATPIPEQHARQPDSWSEGPEETESSDTLMPEPLNVNTSTGQWDDFRRSVGDLKYPAVQYLPHRQSMPPQNLSRIGPPELQRSQSASYAPVLSQPPYQPLVSFNPNMAYGASSMAAGPPPTIRPRQTTHKVSFPLQYDPHALYKYVFQRRLRL